MVGLFCLVLICNYLFHLADILLCWIWLVLPWITSEHRCHSGQLNLFFIQTNPSFYYGPGIFSLVAFSVRKIVMFFISLDYWIISLNAQQVYMYFRGSGKAAEMKREAARGALSSAFWWTYGSDYSQLMDRRKPDVSFEAWDLVHRGSTRISILESVQLIRFLSFCRL